MARKSKKSLESIEAEIAVLKAQADQIRAQERIGVIERIRDAIGVYQITSSELGFRRSPLADKRTSKRLTSSKKKAVRAAKYGDDSGNTWSGLGKRPNWFKAALASGTSAEHLLIK